MSGMLAACGALIVWAPLLASRWPDRPRIVAMTASAVRDDREICLAVGMDPDVTKPIRVDALVQALSGTGRRGKDA